MVYDHNNGLPASLYYAVCQSSDGYLWIGSSSGLVRFDGERYKIFFSDYADTNSISDNVIVDLVEDDEQNLWIAGLYQGLSKLNLRTGKIKRYSRLSLDSTQGYGINGLFKDPKGHLWIATAGRGLAHYLPVSDSFEFFIPNPDKPFDGSDPIYNHVSDIAPDQSDENILWLSCFDALYSFNQIGKSFERFELMNEYNKSQNLSFLSVETDRYDKIWLGTWINGLISFDKRTHEFASYPYAKAESPNTNRYQVLEVKSINDSILYLAARNLGLLSFNKNTFEIQSILANEMLPDGSSGIDLQHISITPDAGVFAGGNYYLYQQHSSFNRFGKSVSFTYGPGYVLQKVIFDKQRNGYWIGSLNAGEIVFLEADMKHRILYKAESQTEFQCIDLAIDNQNDVWAVSPFSGLLKWKKGKLTFRRVGKEIPAVDTIAREIVCVESDEKGNLWLLTRQTLFYYETGSGLLNRLNIMQQDEPLYELTLCAGKKNDVWIGSDQGLFHYSPVEEKLVHLVPETSSHKGIANRLVKSMTVDKYGNAWLGFESDGVQVVDPIDHRIISKFNLDDGLPGMQINHMATDSAGRIWVGTSAGLAVFDPASETGTWQLFNREDGIKRDYIDRPIVTTDDGKLFFNIDGGISWVDFGDEYVIADRKPRLHLVTLLADGKPYGDELLPEHLTSVDLSYDTKEVSIEFAAMDWLHPFRTKYFYRIEGITKSNDWIENDQAMISLTGMKPGNFLLRLYAVNGDGIKSDEFELPILIRPPFWQRWWFIALCVASFLLLGYAIYRYRIGQLKKLQAMRNTISTNLHDDIGASLSNIHILTVLTQRNIHQPESATSYITKAGDEIQRISESLSDIVWNINPKYDDLGNLFIRMKRYAADMLDGKNIASELIFPENPDKFTMPMDQRRDFYLIFKEAINNLTKYADATTATVKVTTNHDSIHLEVSDNGKGFDKHEVQFGNGMQNMKQRAEKWKSIFHVSSEPGQGTRISMNMKVN